MTQDELQARADALRKLREQLSKLKNPFSDSESNERNHAASAGWKRCLCDVNDAIDMEMEKGRVGG
jgi:hypothetical protein